jgi:undecaprenyl-diphosphatase
MEWLVSIDEQLMVVLNHLFPSSTDVFWLTVTKFWVWIPLYIAILHRLWLASSPAQFLIRLALIVVAILLWDQGANVAKHYFQRPRPCQTLDSIRILAHCSPYGFFSAHAANTFGLAFLLRRWLHASWFPVLLFAAIIQSFSRLHIGVHYPTDLLIGALWGILVSLVLLKTEKKWN